MLSCMRYFSLSFMTSTLSYEKGSVVTIYQYLNLVEVASSIFCVAARTFTKGFEFFFLWRTGFVVFLLSFLHKRYEEYQNLVLFGEW